MMNNEKWLCRRLLVLVTILFGAAGCTLVAELPWGPALTPTAPPPPTNTPLPAPTSTPTPTVVPPSQGLAIELWVPEFLSPHQDNGLGEAFAAQLMSFTRTYPYRNLQVNTTVKRGTGTGGLYNLMSTAWDVAPSVLPDLLILNQHDLLLAGAEGFLQPLDGHLPATADYYTATFNAVRDGTALWAFPYLARADQMAYRPAITDTVPLTWTDVLSGGYSMLLPGAAPEGLAGDALLQVYLGSGGRVVDQSGQPSLDRATLERMYRFFIDLERAGLLDSERALTMTSAAMCWDAYQQGVADFVPVPFGLFWADEVENAIPSWVPTEEGAPITVFHTWGIAVVAQDPVRRDAALMLARWLVAASNMAEVARAGELAPTRRSALAAWGLDSDGVQFAEALLSHGVTALPHTIDVPVRRALQAGFVALLQREVDTPEAAASAALTALRR